MAADDARMNADDARMNADDAGWLLTTSDAC